MGRKLNSTASFVPDDFEEIRAKRRKHSLSSQAFPYFTDQRVPFSLLVNRKGRPVSFAGCASLAHSVPGWGCCVPARDPLWQCLTSLRQQVNHQSRLLHFSEALNFCWYRGVISPRTSVVSSVSPDKHLLMLFPCS